jgi:hypothetical protein
MEKETLSSIEMRYGGVDTKIKLYFKDAEDLEIKVEQLNKRLEKIVDNLERVKDKAKKLLE